MSKYKKNANQLLTIQIIGLPISNSTFRTIKAPYWYFRNYQEKSFLFIFVCVLYFSKRSSKSFLFSYNMYINFSAANPYKSMNHS